MYMTLYLLISCLLFKDVKYLKSISMVSYIGLLHSFNMLDLYWLLNATSFIMQICWSELVMKQPLQSFFSIQSESFYIKLQSISYQQLISTSQTKMKIQVFIYLMLAICLIQSAHGKGGETKGKKSYPHNLSKAQSYALKNSKKWFLTDSSMKNDDRSSKMTTGTETDHDASPPLTWRSMTDRTPLGLRF